MSLKRFFSKPENISPVVSIIQGTEDLSLRLIDWFVTNYAKRNNSIAVVDDTQFSIYHSYRTQLETYSKHQFDPFRRHQRIRYVYDGENSIETTVGQLNFFRWAVENGILEHIRRNKAAIEKDMATLVGQAASSSSQGGRERQQADRIQRCKTTVSFD
nr:hypothetical protein TetV2_00324 [Oceanusvirus sp.]